MATATAHADIRAQSRDIASSAAANDVIYFRSDSAVLDQQARYELEEAVAWLQANPERELMLEGHASRGGSADYNQALSYERARNAKEYIVSRGISASRVHVKALGEQFRISESAAGNRRVFLYATRTELPMPQPTTVTLVPTSQPTSQPATARVEVVVMPGTAPAPATTTTTTTTTVRQPGEQVDVSMVDVSMEDAAEVLAGHERLIFPFGASLTLGAGVTGFLDAGTRAYAGTGGLWEARLSLGTHSMLAVEAAYVGTLQNLDARGLSDDALLNGNGIEANVRINPMAEALTQPYVFAGLGWTHYSLANTATDISTIADHNDTMYVPAGVGLGLHWNNMVVDMRATARLGLYGDLFDRAMVMEEEDLISGNLNSWAVSARLGWEL